jgi:hypothetical protein
MMSAVAVRIDHLREMTVDSGLIANSCLYNW